MHDTVTSLLRLIGKRNSVWTRQVLVFVLAALLPAMSAFAAPASPAGERIQPHDMLVLAIPQDGGAPGEITRRELNVKHRRIVALKVVSAAGLRPDDAPVGVGLPPSRALDMDASSKLALAFSAHHQLGDHLRESVAWRMPPGQAPPRD